MSLTQPLILRYWSRLVGLRGRLARRASPTGSGQWPRCALLMEQAYLVVVREFRWPAVAGWAAHDNIALSDAPLVVPSAHPWAGLGVRFGQARVRYAVALAGGFDRVLIVGAISTALRKVLMSMYRRVYDLSQDVAQAEVLQSALQRLMSASGRENKEGQNRMTSSTLVQCMGTTLPAAPLHVPKHCVRSNKRAYLADIVGRIGSHKAKWQDDWRGYCEAQGSARLVMPVKCQAVDLHRRNTLAISAPKRVFGDAKWI